MCEYSFKSSCKTCHDVVAHLICVNVYLDFLPEELASVIESRKVLELTQKFYRGLRAITVQPGHIQIIHKDHQLLITRSSYKERGENG